MFGRLKAEKSGARSIDGMRNPRTMEKSAAVLDAKVLPWKAEITETKHQGSDEEQQAAERRQNRIIAFFGVDEKATVTPEEIVNSSSRSLKELQRRRANELRRAVMTSENPEVTTKQRQKVSQKLAKGEITSEDEANFLLLIEGPLKTVGAEKMFETLSADPRQTQILAVAVGMNASNWQQVDQTAMKKMLTSLQTDGDDYRTPVGFASLKAHFLKGIRPRANEQVYRHYVQSMQELERVLYGERVDYYQEFEKLRKELAGQTAVLPEEGNDAVMVAQPKKKLTTVAAIQSGEMLGRAVIEGDAWRHGNMEKYLTTHDLMETRLGPTYEVEVGGMKICLSEIFPLANGDVAVMAYVLAGKNIKVRTFYRAAQQTLWRYLPDYTRKADGEINRYLSGVSTESVTLPIELQEALVRIEKKRGIKTWMTPNYAPEFFVAGTAWGYDSLQDYQAAWHYGRLKGDYYTEVSMVASNHDYGVNGPKQKKAPYTLAIDAERSPDFGKKWVEFELETADAGTVRAEGFKSHDEQYLWLFARDRLGRAWVLQVEAVSPITSTGLRRDWLEMGDFTTALYEPTKEAGIYGDRDDTKGARQCMWKNYLSNIPLIQEYVRRVKN